MRTVYREKKYTCGEYLDVFIYPVFPAGKRGGKREIRKPSTEAQKKLNQRHREEKVKRKLHANFTPEDLELHLKRAVLHTENGPDLIPANRRLADAAARLQVMQLSQYNAVGDAERSCEKVMDSLLAPLRTDYDYIIIDCGLKQELLTVNALAASHYCIIPVQAHFLASEGIPEVLELVRSVQAKFNPNLKIAGILLTMYQSRPQLCRSVRESVGDIYGEHRPGIILAAMLTFAGMVFLWKRRPTTQ